MRDPCLAHRPLAGRLGRVASHRQAHVQTTPPDDRQSSQCPLWGAALMHPAVKGHPMATGTVRWFNEQKGYGFIQLDQGGKGNYPGGWAARLARGGAFGTCPALARHA